MPPLIAILDAAYTQTAAGVGCVLAAGWEAASSAAEVARHIPGTPAQYEPGAFYKRELPLLLAVIQALPDKPEAYVIDGYVWLGEGKPGLGAHLFERLGASAPVIGVAKSAFQGDTWPVPVLRGRSKRPLFVTAAGMEAAQAAALVASMHGADRIPTLLRRADRLARDAAGGAQTG